MDPKLIRIRELINEQEKIETELTQLVEGTDKAKRKWSRRPKADGQSQSDQPED